MYLRNFFAKMYANSTTRPKIRFIWRIKFPLNRRNSKLTLPTDGLNRVAQVSLYNIHTCSLSSWEKRKGVVINVWFHFEPYCRVWLCELWHLQSYGKDTPGCCFLIFLCRVRLVGSGPLGSPHTRRVSHNFHATVMTMQCSLSAYAREIITLISNKVRPDNDFGMTIFVSRILFWGGKILFRKEKLIKL